MKLTARLTALLAVASLASMSAAQQSTPPAADSPAQTQGQSQTPPPARPPTAKDPAGAKPGIKSTPSITPSGTSNDRLFYTLPNFLSLETTAKLPPLTAKEKFGVVARGTFDPIEVPWWGILSAISQAQNSEPAYGQGWAAYGKRYATTGADSIVENFMTGAVFPSVLHQDPRFYQKSEGGFTNRMSYSISRIFVTRTDSGKSQFNYSEIIGGAAAAAISTYSYHPHGTYISTPTNPHKFVPSDRTLVNAGHVWATQVSLDTITIVVKEFWPDIHRRISHKNKDQEPPVLGPTATEPKPQ
jgi:hypothetical protein